MFSTIALGHDNDNLSIPIKFHFALIVSYSIIFQFPPHHIPLSTHSIRAGRGRKRSLKILLLVPGLNSRFNFSSSNHIPEDAGRSCSSGGG